LGLGAGIGVGVIVAEAFEVSNSATRLPSKIVIPARDLFVLVHMLMPILPEKKAGGKAGFLGIIILLGLLPIIYA
jgi:hypothetical protein